jgi:nitrate reductase gamma subunit
MPAIQILIYISLAILLVWILLKVAKISRMPVHLRWELYPIPHQRGKSHYGGSYYEDPDWWIRPDSHSLAGEIREMLAEIFALKTLFKNNRSLWYFSFPLHWGLYFLICFSILLIVNAAAEVLLGKAIVSMAGPLANFIEAATIACGAAGWILGGLGATGLLVMRILQIDLRRQSRRSDYFNLILLLAIFISGNITWLAYDRSMTLHAALARSLISFSAYDNLPFAMKAEVILTVLFFIYLPFTHMTHFVGKFFTFHRVRWQDAPNLPGSRMESDINKAFGQTISWSAPHMQAGKTWDQAASGPDSDTSGSA